MELTHETAELAARTVAEAAADLANALGTFELAAAAVAEAHGLAEVKVDTEGRLPGGKPFRTVIVWSEKPLFSTVVSATLRR